MIRRPPRSTLERSSAASDVYKRQRYKTGQKVRHAKFGDGTVIESKLSGTDEEVTVAFPGIGIKRLAAAFANLEITG